MLHAKSLQMNEMHMYMTSFHMASNRCIAIFGRNIRSSNTYVFNIMSVMLPQLHHNSKHTLLLCNILCVTK